MYLEYFGLKKRPFGITPDTSLFFEGGERGDVLDAVLYALNVGEGIIKVVGEVGSGKTMLTRMLVNKAPNNTVFVFLLNPSIQAEQVLYAIAYDLGLKVDANDKSTQILHELQKKLFDLYNAGKKVVLIVDEAQQMPLTTLEEIRLLSNLETETEKLLQIVLFGQPELDEHIDTTSVRQLKERITYSFYLNALSWKVVDKYLHFRLEKAGHQGRAIFTNGAIKSLTKYANGTLRRLNVLADKSLLAAYLEKSVKVDVKHVKQALKDSTKGYEKSQAAYYVLLSMLLFFGAAGVAGYFFLQAEEKQASLAVNQEISKQGSILNNPPVAKSTVRAQKKSTVHRSENLKEKAAPRTIESFSQVNERTKAFDAWLNSTKAIYTIQLMSLVGEASLPSLRSFISLAAKRLGEDKLYIKKSVRGDYVVFYRGFSKYSSALSELKKLPLVIRRNKPFIIKIKNKHLGR